LKKTGKGSLHFKEITSRTGFPFDCHHSCAFITVNTFAQYFLSFPDSIFPDLDLLNIS